MESLHLFHLILICLWGGLILAEGVIEVAARDESSLRAAARFHYFIDLCAEIPLVLGVLFTGALLAWRAQPLTSLHWIKILAGLMAIGVNLYCGTLVIKRYAHLQDGAQLRLYHARILRTTVGIPFAIVAAALGLFFFRG